VIKKIQLELFIFTIILISILFTYKADNEIYNFFSNLNYGYGSAYLKEFFVKITYLGDSLWYFLFFSIFFSYSFFAKTTKLISVEKYHYIRKFSFFGFAYLLLVGLVTQIIKHLIGRPRPNHSQLDGSFEFVFFTTESAFHSFPSGHSSTIIAIALIASLVLPSLRYFFYVCGFLIALSRIVVGAHFVTDVVAGSLIAIMVFKVFDFFIKERYPKIYWNSLDLPETSILIKTTIAIFILAIFVTVGSTLDIYISSLFYYGKNQFWIQSYYPVSIFFRKILLPLLLIYIFLLPMIIKFTPIKKLYFNYKFSLSELFFIWLSGIFTMLLVVNVLLKNMWGRARPNDILQFGGVESFTPWYKIVDVCASNCSFVSGDSSVGFLLVVFYFITKKNNYLYLAIFFGFLLGLIRIIAGGHFFSDIIFSYIVVTASVLVSFVLYKKLYAK
tara:strand:- start:101 stop:1429 length:1329 start_codon:yes stop_codon:yes gene_type:complete